MKNFKNMKKHKNIENIGREERLGKTPSLPDHLQWSAQWPPWPPSITTVVHTEDQGLRDNFASGTNTDAVPPSFWDPVETYIE